MSKQINPQDLATIVTQLLTKPESVGQLDTDAQFKSFMTDIAQVVCNHCGGEVRHEASFLDDVCYVGIHGNDSLPEDGGIWKDYDKEGEL
ncbi:hypothetical protein [Burkholderia ubonensis]|uniref:hypothetical protein n=1 Tax=Burkholderia ubonensis TaxID=101571 RepID=UPI00075BAFE0|nr:hypothetical protein [Burkholderia ubonensis]KVP16889.1 hypothetical protein WJ84_01045 [Burkholderia ubonensis]KVP39988.1 hypothetical protein WJ87_07330 [Burkholderia ubonensis]